MYEAHCLVVVFGVNYAVNCHEGRLLSLNCPKVVKVLKPIFLWFRSRLRCDHMLVASILVSR